jgi:hypothetical protein
MLSAAEHLEEQRYRLTARKDFRFICNSPFELGTIALGRDNGLWEEGIV